MEIEVGKTYRIDEPATEYRTWLSPDNKESVQQIIEYDNMVFVITVENDMEAEMLQNSSDEDSDDVLELNAFQNWSIEEWGDADYERWEDGRIDDEEDWDEQLEEDGVNFLEEKDWYEDSVSSWDIIPPVTVVE